MEVVVTGRHTEVRDNFRRHVEDKLEKVNQLAPRVQRIDVELSHENNRRQSSSCERVEITVRDKGPVVRAEACADDPYAALDLATTKLLERLRRSRDRRKVHHGRHRPTSVRQATANLTTEMIDAAPVGTMDPSRAVTSEPDQVEQIEHDPLDASPVVIREKTHDGVPMTLDQALYEMELVGHDFYLFVDAATSTPSVVYRRRGWDYGVIHLDVQRDGEVRDVTSSDGEAATARTSSDATVAAVVAAAVP
ncbi:MAG: ribosome hibernation-promoting factor, HPF/YfiA family [Janthinobacterium lividum]